MSASVIEDQLQEQEYTQDYLTLVIDNQKFGIPVLQVQDVLSEQKITNIPLSPPEVAGSMNLRGHIVTAISVRQRLNMESIPLDQAMGVVVEHNEELYSLIIDKVGDVISLKKDAIERNPGMLDQRWKEIANGVYQLDKELLVIIDVSKLLGTVTDSDNKG